MRDLSDFRGLSVFLASVVLGVLGTLPPAFAEPLLKVQIIYERNTGTEDCPDDSALRAAVAARLGYDPFDVEAETVIVAVVARAEDGVGLAATVDVKSGSGSTEGRRRLASREGDCRELASAMVLAISIAIDPLNLGQADRPSNPEPTVALPEAEPRNTPRLLSTPSIQLTSTTRTTSRRPLRFETGVGLRLGGGYAPGIIPGIAVQLKAGRGDYSLGLEGRADFSRAIEIDSGSIEASLLGLSLVPCRDFGRFAVCGLATLGLFRAAGVDLPEARRVSSAAIIVGSRVSLGFSLAKSIEGRLEGELAGNLARTTLLVGERSVWSTPPVGGSLGFALVVRLR